MLPQQLRQASAASWAGALVVLAMAIGTGCFVGSAFASPDPSSTSFSISGDLAAPLYPGTSQPLDLAFSNPNQSTITVSAVHIDLTTNNAACSASANFAVSPLATANVRIPPGASAVSLSDLDVPVGEWPIISMIQTASNQDACQGVLLTLNYRGSVTG